MTKSAFAGIPWTCYHLGTNIYYTKRYIYGRPLQFKVLNQCLRFYVLRAPRFCWCIFIWHDVCMCSQNDHVIFQNPFFLTLRIFTITQFGRSTYVLYSDHSVICMAHCNNFATIVFVFVPTRYNHQVMSKLIAMHMRRILRQAHPWRYWAYLTGKAYILLLGFNKIVFCGSKIRKNRTKCSYVPKVPIVRIIRIFFISGFHTQFPDKIADFLKSG